MNSTMKRVPLALLAIVLVAAAALLGLWHADGGTDTARAAGPVVVALDMDTTGNSCPGDGVTDCTLGVTNSCISVSAGAVVPFDVTVSNLPASVTGSGQGTIDFKLLWGAAASPPDPDVINITARQSGVNYVNW
jgi:hypothetical protein